ncbi:oxidoreductase [Neorhizobium sp. NCHU2750]|uniref:oxidoreductase n=1 Tax=Neorhizobium sp. NCHU2750 TaxID=1825976 RepID=UPI000E7617B7|nr:short-chain dehydrogenase [Neorhizobium sp. NCHU2750]
MRTWFITGASRGFGALIAEKALAKGDNVVATARNPQTINARFGEHENLLAVALDVNDEAEAHEAARAAVSRFGSIDVLVNNAGFGLLGAIEEATAAEIEAIYRTNVFGLLSVTRAVLPHMRRQRSGHILNFSSVGGYRSAAGFGVYCSAKFAVEGLTEALADELAPLGIFATAVEPGYFRTDFLEGNSLSVSPTVIADYAETSGVVREKAKIISRNQPGNPVRLAEVLVDFVDMENPPVRLPLGSDTVVAIEAKIASDMALLERMRTISLSTDFATTEAV